MNNKFNKGDIVEIANDCCYIKKGMIGKIVNTTSIRYNKQNETIWYGVDWWGNVNGYDIGGLTKCGHGFYVPEKDIKLCNLDEPLLAR